MIGPYYFDNERVKGIENYQMLHSSILSEAGQFLENGVLQQDGAPPRITRAVCSCLHEMFLKLWSARCGPAGRPAKSYYLASLHFFLLGFIKNQLYRTSVPSTKLLESRIATAIRIFVRNLLPRLNQLGKLITGFNSKIGQPYRTLLKLN